MNRLRNPPLMFRGVFILWVIGLLAFSLATIWQRAKLDLDGTIQSREEKRDPSGPHRYYTIYTIHPATGRDSFQYVAHGNDSALPRDLSIGARIAKRRWHLSYSIGDQVVDDFPRVFYWSVAGAGFSIVCVAVTAFCRKWKTYAV